jgi:hypothetical protein
LANKEGKTHANVNKQRRMSDEDEDKETKDPYLVYDRALYGDAADWEKEKCFETFSQTLVISSNGIRPRPAKDPPFRSRFGAPSLMKGMHC